MVTIVAAEATAKTRLMVADAVFLHHLTGLALLEVVSKGLAVSDISNVLGQASRKAAPEILALVVGDGGGGGLLDLGGLGGGRAGEAAENGADSPVGDGRANTESETILDGAHEAAASARGRHGGRHGRGRRGGLV